MTLETKRPGLLVAEVFDERLEFAGHDGEFDRGFLAFGCVEGEQVGLLSDGGDEFDDVADLGAGFTEFGEGESGGGGDVDGSYRGRSFSLRMASGFCFSPDFRAGRKVCSAAR